MNSTEIRNTFLEFFRSKNHSIVPSAPMVVKNDPSLMFTNAGMNQFKNIFLGNNPGKLSRAANTQKCLRVSGKHNDLEDVGHDGYHHTMFEMLGNWSFGNPESGDGIGKGYFKKDAIEWAWELLTAVFKIPTDRLYATVFEGDKQQDLEADSESAQLWEMSIGKERVLPGSKKDNFWEMGDTGPCGPCSEIHVDIRPDEERKKRDGKLLVNTGNPQVIELWNLVFIQYNRLTGGTLQKLPARHVDTGMGFERLCMVLQAKSSNYDTDVFLDLIREIEKISGYSYGSNDKTDVAFRVISDHIRAIAFSIADGQLPSNTGAGYVIRRILRRAVRHGFSYMNIREPFLFKLVSILSSAMNYIFPELKAQEELVKKVIHEEEQSFLHTLDKGLKRLDQVMKEMKKGSSAVVDGRTCFELYDTYGFPIDLTALILREHGFSIDENGFTTALQEQKIRSRKAASIETTDWTRVAAGQPQFVGYETLSIESELLQYRKVQSKNREFYQLVFNRTPFYPEGGGQAGDTGSAKSENEKFKIIDTKKENELIVHFTEVFPQSVSGKILLQVDEYKRRRTAANHTATHLLHAALRTVLGTHVQQKGSLVNYEQFSFDFSHFEKVNDEQLADIESLVNEKVRKNITGRFEQMAIEDAKRMGAMALFGEKYSDTVRVVTFDKDFSIELCGGTHVNTTGEIGFFKIVNESAVAAGVRRIYAVTARGAEEFINKQLTSFHEALDMLKASSLTDGVKRLIGENQRMKQQLEELLLVQRREIKESLLNRIQNRNGISIIASTVAVHSVESLKALGGDLSKEVPDSVIILGAEIDGKPQLTLLISETLVKQKGLNASQIIRILATEIEGGGGGHPHFATAGGKKGEGLARAISRIGEFLK